MLVYKAKWLDYKIAKRFVKLKHIGLANIVSDFAGDGEIHPELIQDDVTAKNILKRVKRPKRGRFLGKIKSSERG